MESPGRNNSRASAACHPDGQTCDIVRPLHASHLSGGPCKLSRTLTKLRTCDLLAERKGMFDAPWHVSCRARPLSLGVCGRLCNLPTLGCTQKFILMSCPCGLTRSLQHSVKSKSMFHTNSSRDEFNDGGRGTQKASTEMNSRPQLGLDTNHQLRVYLFVSAHGSAALKTVGHVIPCVCRQSHSSNLHAHQGNQVKQSIERPSPHITI